MICGFGHRRRLTLNGGGVEDLNCVAVNPLGEGDGSRMDGEVKSFCDARPMLCSSRLKNLSCLGQNFHPFRSKTTMQRPKNGS